MEDVTIGWGLLGRLREGGTFRVERSAGAPGLWQITETHVHIEGKVLFFKISASSRMRCSRSLCRCPRERRWNRPQRCRRPVAVERKNAREYGCMLGDDGTTPYPRSDRELMG